MAYRLEAILSTGFPIVSAQEYDVHDLSAQRSSLASLRCYGRKVGSCIGASLIVDKCLHYCILQQFIRDIYR